MMTASAESSAVEMASLDGSEPDRRYVGLATRVIAFVLDAVVVNVVAIVAELGAALILSLLHLPKGVHTVVVALGAAAYVLWLIGYFVVFWSTTGQTPGARVMQIRVVRDGDGEVGARRAFIRSIGVFLAALPLFLGYVPILFDSKRRGFQDRLAATVVVQAEQLSIAEAARLSKRAASEAARGQRSLS